MTSLLFLLIGIDSEGDNRETRFRSLEVAKASGHSCMKNDDNGGLNV